MIRFSVFWTILVINVSFIVNIEYWVWVILLYLLFWFTFLLLSLSYRLLYFYLSVLIYLLLVLRRIFFSSLFKIFLKLIFDSLLLLKVSKLLYLSSILLLYKSIKLCVIPWTVWFAHIFLRKFRAVCSTIILAWQISILIFTLFLFDSS
jgi:hypothetical protein